MRRGSFSTVLLVAAAALGLASAARAATIAVWNFNDSTLNAARDSVVGTPTLTSSLAVVYSSNATFGATTVGADAGDPPGFAFRALSGSGLGHVLTFSIDTTGWSGLSLTYAPSGFGTGYSNHQWAWSSDGSTFTNLASPTVDNSGFPSTITTIDFSGFAALDNNPLAALRFSLSDGPGGSASSSFDNFVFSANTVGAALPLPAAAPAGAVLLSAIALYRKRRGS